MVAIAFIFAMCVLGSQGCAIFWDTVKRWKLRRNVSNQCRKRLQKLTDDEKLVLKRYIEGQTRTQNLDFTSGIVAGLAEAGILYRPTIFSGDAPFFAFNMTDFAWDYLHKHPESLAGLDIGHPGQKPLKR